MSDIFTKQARALLKAPPGLRQGAVREDPVDGMRFVHDVDPILDQINGAARALRVRARFAAAHPGFPPLPLNYADRERAKYGREEQDGIETGLGFFARSLMVQDYDLDKHPSFEDFMRGFLCSARLRLRFPKLAALYPPKPLAGLTPEASYWRPPAQLKRVHAPKLKKRRRESRP